MTDLMQIPTIDSSNIHNFFYGKDSRWLQPKTPFEFYVDRVEDIIERLTDAYPLPPHRKTVTGCFFLTRGNSRRSKGLKEYDFGDNQFFFSPAYQITSVEYISKDAEGYYVQFHDDIFRNLSFYRILEDCPFLDSLANPIVAIPREKCAPILELLKRLEKLHLELGKDAFELAALYLVTLMTEVNRFVIDDVICTKDSAARITKKL
jgi:AraC family transcriptional activator of pobA